MAQRLGGAKRLNTIQEGPPDEPILDRGYPSRRIANDLEPHVAYLAELVDYGVQFMKRALASSARDVPAVVILPVLLRQALAFADAVYIHLRAGAVYSSVPDLRSLFEATLSMEWILVGPPSRRVPTDEWVSNWTRQFYVAELRAERVWTRRCVPGTHDHAVFRKAAPKLAADLVSKPAVVQGARDRLKEIQRHIRSRPLLRAANQRLGPLAKKLGREPEWYRPAGPSSLRQMAQRLERDAEYEVLYKQWSEVSHGSRSSTHISITGSTLVIDPIRSPAELPTILLLTSRVLERALLLAMDRFRPDEVATFADKRTGEWAQMRRVPEVSLNFELTGKV